MATSPDVRQRACLREMDVILLKARNEKREFTPAESQEFERLTGEFDKLDEDRHKFPDSGLLRSVTYHPDGAESSDDPTHRDAIFGKGGRLTSGRFEELQQRCGMDATDWRGFSGAEAEYFQVLASQRWDPRLTKRAGQSTLIDSEGGFGVPAPLAAAIFNTSLEQEIIRPRARQFAMTSRTLGIPAWDSGGDHSGKQLFGGIAAKWEGETSSLDIQTAKLRKTVLEARKLAFLGKVSTELAEDSPSFAQQFREALQEAATWHLDDAFLNGEGGSKPEGIRNSPAIVTQAKETGQAAATIVWENVVGMWSRLWASSRNNSIWVANGDVIPQLYLMNIAVGTAGVPVFQPASQPAATLFGRPILFTEKLPTLGTAGDILLVDPMMYAVGIRAEVDLRISPDVYFTTDELAFRLRVRIDGKSLWDKALTPANGTNTVSPFVQLATRS